MKKIVPQYVRTRIRPMDDVFRLIPVSQNVLVLPKKPGGHVKRRRVPAAASLVAVVLLCATSAGITYGAPAPTVAFFSDMEKSAANVLSAGILGITLSATPTTYTFGDGAVPDILSSAATPAAIPGSFPMSLRVTFDDTGGVPALCAALALSATGTPFTYSGSLLSFSATTSSFAPFTFDVSLPDDTGLADGDTCTLDIVYRAWAAGTPENTGYTDEKRVPYSFTYHAPVVLFSAPLMLLDESTPPTDEPPADPPLDEPPADPPADSPPADELPPTDPPPVDPPADPPAETPPAEVPPTE